jgi:hypothetical protein
VDAGIKARPTKMSNIPAAAVPRPVTTFTRPATSNEAADAPVETGIYDLVHPGEMAHSDRRGAYA